MLLSLSFTVCDCVCCVKLDTGPSLTVTESLSKSIRGLGSLWFVLRPGGDGMVFTLYLLIFMFCEFHVSLNTRSFY
jgi:hypothetical protein